MFQEFVNRTRLRHPRARVVAALRRAPGGPLRRAPSRSCSSSSCSAARIRSTTCSARRCAAAARLHPLLKRIMQIHVTEEARHLCFARHYLKEHAPRLGPVRRFVLSRRAPFILAIMAQMMMRPSAQIVRTYGIPRAVIREAYTRNPRAPGTHARGAAQGARAVRRDRHRHPGVDAGVEAARRLGGAACTGDRLRHRRGGAPCAPRRRVRGCEDAAAGGGPDRRCG